jgi:hypothetical protein
MYYFGTFIKTRRKPMATEQNKKTPQKQIPLNTQTPGVMITSYSPTISPSSHLNPDNNAINTIALSDQEDEEIPIAEQLKNARTIFNKIKAAFVELDDIENINFNQTNKYSIKAELTAMKSLEEKFLPLYEKICRFYLKHKTIQSCVDLLLEFEHAYFTQYDQFIRYVQNIEKVISLFSKKNPQKETLEILNSLKTDAAYNYAITFDKKTRIEHQRYTAAYPEEQKSTALLTEERFEDIKNIVNILHENIENLTAALSLEYKDTQYKIILSKYLLETHVFLIEYDVELSLFLTIPNKQRAAAALRIPSLQKIGKYYSDLYQSKPSKPLSKQIYIAIGETLRCYEIVGLTDPHQKTTYLTLIQELLQNASCLSENDFKSDNFEDLQITIYKVTCALECGEKGNRLDNSNKVYRDCSIYILNLITTSLVHIKSAAQKTQLISLYDEHIKKLSPETDEISASTTPTSIPPNTEVKTKPAGDKIKKRKAEGSPLISPSHSPLTMSAADVNSDAVIIRAPNTFRSSSSLQETIPPPQNRTQQPLLLQPPASTSYFYSLPLKDNIEIIHKLSFFGNGCYHLLFENNLGKLKDTLSRYIVEFVTLSTKIPDSIVTSETKLSIIQAGHALISKIELSPLATIHYELIALANNFIYCSSLCSFGLQKLCEQASSLSSHRQPSSSTQMQTGSPVNTNRFSNNTAFVQRGGSISPPYPPNTTASFHSHSPPSMTQMPQDFAPQPTDLNARKRASSLPHKLPRTDASYASTTSQPATTYTPLAPPTPLPGYNIQRRIGGPGTFRQNRPPMNGPANATNSSSTTTTTTTTSPNEPNQWHAFFNSNPSNTTHNGQVVSSPQDNQSAQFK